MEQQPSRFCKILSTGFGVGYSPYAPGTLGALLACVLWLPFFLFLDYGLYLLTVIILTIVLTYYGVRTADAVEKIWGKDPKRVVVDEMVGVLIPLLFVPSNNSRWYWYAIAAFALFRFFDILKPLGIRRMEQYRGGVGVMMDDILAGIYSSIILLLIRWVVG